MYLRQLRYFVAIVEQGSFSKAAQSLRIAQPALSLHVRNMEADFGAPLLDRPPRGVTTTTAGELLLHEARGMIRQFEATQRAIKALDVEPQGIVRFGLPSAIDRVIGAELFLECGRRFPKIELQFAEAISGFVKAWIEQGTVDAGLLYAPAEGSRLVSSKILSEPLLLVAGIDMPVSRTMNDLRTVSCAELAVLPMVMVREGNTLRDAVVAQLAVRGIALRATHVIDSHASLLALVKQGLAFSLFPESAAREEIARGTLRGWRIVDPPMTASVYLVLGESALRSNAVDAVSTLSKMVLAKMITGHAA